MSSIRQTKWDWSVHLPKMIELYNGQASIPDIHKAIQCTGFEPCQRAVYHKFKSIGYPTDIVGRTKFLEARSYLSTGSEAGGDMWTRMPPPDAYSHPRTEYTASTMARSSQLAADARFWDANIDLNSPASTLAFRSPSSQELYSPTSDARIETPVNPHLRDSTFDPIEQEISKSYTDPAWSGSGNNFGLLSSSFDPSLQSPDRSMELGGSAYFGIDIGAEPQYTVTGMSQAPGSLGNFKSSNIWRPELDELPCRPLSSNVSMKDLDFYAPGSGSRGAYLQPSSKPSQINNEYHNSISTFRSTSTRNKLRSLFRSKSAGSFKGKKLYATSHYTSATEDSGYASGYVSSVALDRAAEFNTQSLLEFNGLYRVACQTLHEPRGKAHYKDSATCASCQYSGIHNLGWSARYLKLEVFLSELKLVDVYDFAAVDAAGNSALHYAAAGGASYHHLKALIDVGVDPYLANTAGELFVYSLRPLEPFTLEPNFDCLKSNDLAKLLCLLDLRRILAWRDNDGQTIMHTLALKIREPELKAMIFKLLADNGHRVEVPDRSGKTADEIAPLDYDCHGQVIESAVALHQIFENAEEAEDTEEITAEAMIMAEFRTDSINQIKAHTTIVEARHQPTYIDAETGDNAFHALSQISSSNSLLNNDRLPSYVSSLGQRDREGNGILLNLQYFISQGVDLNLHNREGSHPLKAFVCERPWDEDETGATMSKYLDMLLWKDQKVRIKNDIKVNMKDRSGATALYCAAIRGRPDSVRSLIEAGANVNARSVNDLSVLSAAYNALDEAVRHNDSVLAYLLKETISHLEHAGAVHEPSSLQERGARKN